MDKSDAEDVAQLAFEKYAKLDNHFPIENPRAFLFRVAHNIVLDQKRRTKSQEKYVAAKREETAQVYCNELDPERVLSGEERLEIITNLLLRMPEQRRRMIVLCCFDGLTFAEASRQTGLSQSVVRKHVQNGLADCLLALK